MHKWAALHIIVHADVLMRSKLWKYHCMLSKDASCDWERQELLCYVLH